MNNKRRNNEKRSVIRSYFMQTEGEAKQFVMDNELQYDLEDIGYYDNIRGFVCNHTELDMKEDGYLGWFIYNTELSTGYMFYFLEAEKL